MVNPIKVLKGLLEVEEQLGDFIQNGPSTGLPGYVRDRYRHRCDEFANLPPWARALSGVTGGSIKRFCEPYWSDRGFDGPEANPPLVSGGQCAGVNYDVTIQTRDQNGNANAPTVRQGDQGPIRIISNPPTINCEGAPDGFTAQPEYIYQRAGINTLAFGNFCGVADPLISVIAVPSDGSPDECGDQEPDAPLRPGPNPPPNPGPLPGPEPTDNPDPENPIPFFPIPPFEDPDFGPQPIVGPDQTGGGGEPGPPAGGDGLPGDEDAIGGAAGEVNAGEEGEEVDFGPPPEGRVWVGCIVNLTVDSRIGSIPGTGPQSTVWPSVRGNVALKYASFFGTSYRINSRYTEVFRPNTSLIVTGCFLQVQPGGSALVFPVSALKCPSNPCGEENG